MKVAAGRTSPAPLSRQPSAPPLRRRTYVLWPVFVSIAFLAAGIAGLTGSSWFFEVRRDLLHAAEVRERPRELFARSRSIRSDEYAVDLPLARAQQTTTPKYPLVNLDVGLGELQRNPFDVPVLDWGLAFRPYVWPLLVPNRWSHGVRWFLRSGLVLLGLFAWFQVLAGRPRDRSDVDVCRRRSHVAALGAVALFFSSETTWWLGHAMPEILGMAGLVVWAADRAARAASPRRRVVWIAAVGWLSACAFSPFYPPFWAPVLWLVCGSVVDVEYRSAGSLWRAVRRSVPVMAAIAVGVAIAIVYYAPYLALVKDTLYPGGRVERGGAVPWSWLAEMAWPSLHAVAPLRHDAIYYGVTPSNVCEAAAVEVPPLFVLLALALVSMRVRGAILAAVRGRPGLTAAVAVLFAWVFLPIPSSVGTALLLRWSQSGRTWFAFGAGVALLAGAVIAQLATRREERLTAKTSVIDAAVALLVVAALFAWAQQSLPDGKRAFWFPIVLNAALLVATAPLIRRRAGALAIGVAWALPLLVANGRVNPLLRSSDLFLEGEGHRAVERALLQRPGRLLDLQTHGAATLAGYGWPVLTAVDTAPEASLWTFLAPDTPGVTPALWNRYAHVSFSMSEPTRLVTPDSFVVRIDPCSARFAALGVNHVLTRPGEALPDRCAGDFSSQPAGSTTLWSRRAPVVPIGVATGDRPRSALKFDWHAESGATLERRRDRAVLTVPGPPGTHYAVAMNLSIIEDIRCSGATASLIDTHVVVSPTRASGGRCELRYLGSLGALKRMLEPRTAGDPVVSRLGER